MKTNITLKIVIIYIVCVATLMVGCLDSVGKQNIFNGVYKVDSTGSYAFRTSVDGEWTIYYEICSTEPVTVFVMTRSNYDLYSAGRQFYYVEKYSDVYKISGSHNMIGNGVVLIENNNWISDAAVQVKIDAVKW